MKHIITSLRTTLVFLLSGLLFSIPTMATESAPTAQALNMTPIYAVAGLLIITIIILIFLEPKTK